MGLVRVRRLEAQPTSGHRDGVTLQSGFLSPSHSVSTKFSSLLSFPPFLASFRRFEVPSIVQQRDRLGAELWVQIRGIMGIQLNLGYCLIVID